MAFNPKSLIYNIMKKMMQQLDNKTNLTFILILFWALFWLISSSKLYLNGAFFPWMGISADIAQLFLYLIVIGEAGLALLFISLIVWGKAPPINLTSSLDGECSISTESCIGLPLN